jgi:hypothetical protein
MQIAQRQQAQKIVKRYRPEPCAGCTSLKHVNTRIRTQPHGGMPRVDAWDVKTQPDADVSIGLSRGFAERFTFGQELGRGGFGVVRAVTDAHTGEQLACKTIVKRLAVPNLSAAKQQQHLEKIKRELEVGL